VLRGWIARGSLVAVWLVLTAGVIVAIPGVIALAASPPPECGPPPHLPEPPFVVSAALASYVAGRTVGRWRARRLALVAAEPDGRECERRWRAVPVQVVLTSLLLLATILLAYETFAVATSAWAVTDYARCANVVAHWPTLIGTCSVCYLLGHWLWHLPRR
jgi:hypothetical protein